VAELLIQHLQMHLPPLLSGLFNQPIFPENTPG